MKYTVVGVESGTTKQINAGYGLLIIKNPSIGSCAIYALSEDLNEKVHLIYESASTVFAQISKVSENVISVSATSGYLYIVCIGF